MSVERKSTVVTLWLILLAVSFFSVLPFFWIVLGSFKPHTEVVKGRLSPWQSYEVSVAGEAPSGEQQVPSAGGQTQVRYVTLENYKHILTTLSGLPTYYFNTIYLSVGGTVLALFIGGLAAYGFARFRFPGRDVLFLVLLSTMMIPMHTLIIPRFILYKNLGWLNTLLPLIVPQFFGGAFNVFLLRQYFMSIPMELDDAARIDGCGYLGIFWRIILPLSKPALGAVMVFEFLSTWDDFMGPLIYISSDKNYTVALGLAQFRNDYFIEWNIFLAAAAMAMAVPLVIFFIAQKYFIEGVQLTGAGGVKG